MFQWNTARELTVFITSDEAAFRRVEAALEEDGVRRRVWTTSEYPVLGWTRLDPRLMIRKESNWQSKCSTLFATSEPETLVLCMTSFSFVAIMNSPQHSSFPTTTPSPMSISSANARTLPTSFTYSSP